MLKISDLSFSYLPGQPILEHVSLAAKAGERVCIKGVSGKGKTTLFRLIVGLEQPSAGTITLPPGCKTTLVFQRIGCCPGSRRKTTSPFAPMKKRLFIG